MRRARVFDIVPVVELEELVLAAQAGESIALRGVAFWLFEILDGYFAPRVPSYDADDLSQRCAMVVLRKLDDFEVRGPGSFRRWVLKIAHYELLKVRSEVELEQLPAGLPHSSTFSLASKLHMAELGDLLVSCLAQLPELQREALMWGFEERDDQELADRDEVSIEAIRSRRFRGRQELIKLIKAARSTPQIESPAEG